MMQVLTWLILPIMQSYSTSGEFRVLRRLLAALIENTFYYATYLLLFILFFIYIVIRFGFADSM